MGGVVGFCIGGPEGAILGVEIGSTIGTVLEDEKNGDSVAKIAVDAGAGLLGGGLLGGVLKVAAKAAAKRAAEGLFGGEIKSVVRANVGGVVIGIHASEIIAEIAGGEIGSRLAMKAWDALIGADNASDASLPFAFPQFYTQGSPTAHISPLDVERIQSPPPPIVPSSPFSPSLPLSPSSPSPPSRPLFPPSTPSFPLLPTTPRQPGVLFQNMDDGADDD